MLKPPQQIARRTPLYWRLPYAVIAMNYRHAYHAGNFADVLKHAVLLALIEAMRSKPTPFCVIETHAGSGSYALDSKEAGKTGEYKDGISRLLYPDLHGGKADAAALPPLLRRWLDSVLAVAGNEEGLKVYPGSPLQIANALRADDSAQLCELQSEEASRLAELFHRDARIHTHQRNGYEALKALLPPKEKRGLVLIDPPYEAQEAEYKQLEQAIRLCMQRWHQPSGGDTKSATHDQSPKWPGRKPELQKTRPGQRLKRYNKMRWQCVFRREPVCGAPLNEGGVGVALEPGASAAAGWTPAARRLPAAASRVSIRPGDLSTAGAPSPASIGAARHRTSTAR